MLLNRLGEGVEAEGFTPRSRHFNNLGPVAAAHVDQALAEITDHANNNGLAGFDGVGDGGLHGRTAGATHRDGETVIGLPGVAQHLLHLVHQLEVERIEVTQRWPGDGLQYPRISVRRTWAKQQTIRRCDRIQAQTMGLVHGQCCGRKRRDGHVTRKSLMWRG